MPFSNAERQRRWRDKRNASADALVGTPSEIANGILRSLGADQTRKVVRALDKRLRGLKRNCPVCHGTGFVAVTISTACGLDTGLRPSIDCDCDTADAPVPAEPSAMPIAARR
jgi:hypothetical protein